MCELRFTLSTLPDPECLLAKLWMILEEHDLPTPSISIEGGVLYLLFDRPQDANRVVGSLGIDPPNTYD
jgi:hypothetical protein